MTNKINSTLREFREHQPVISSLLIQFLLIATIVIYIFYHLLSRNKMSQRRTKIKLELHIVLSTIILILQSYKISNVFDSIKS